MSDLLALFPRITITSPHRGSELAIGLMDDAGETRTVMGDLVNTLKGCVLCGAAADLRPGSETLVNIAEARVHGHAIVGTGGNALLNDASGFAERVSTPTNTPWTLEVSG